MESIKCDTFSANGESITGNFSATEQKKMEENTRKVRKIEAITSNALTFPDQLFSFDKLIQLCIYFMRFFDIFIQKPRKSLPNASPTSFNFFRRLTTNTCNKNGLKKCGKLDEILTRARVAAAPYITRKYRPGTKSAGLFRILQQWTTVL